MTLTQKESASNPSYAWEAEFISGGTGEQERCNASVSEAPLGPPLGLSRTHPKRSQGLCGIMRL
jgi:hypothetical protein